MSKEMKSMSMMLHLFLIANIATIKQRYNLKYRKLRANYQLPSNLTVVLR